MNQTQIDVQHLLIGDFVIHNNQAAKVVGIEDNSDTEELETPTMLWISLDNGEDIEVSPEGKINIIEDDGDDFEEFGNHSSRDEY